MRQILVEFNFYYKEKSKGLFFFWGGLVEKSPRFQEAVKFTVSPVYGHNKAFLLGFLGATIPRVIVKLLPNYVLPWLLFLVLFSGEVSIIPPSPIATTASWCLSAIGQ